MHCHAIMHVLYHKPITLYVHMDLELRYINNSKTIPVKGFEIARVIRGCLGHSSPIYAQNLKPYYKCNYIIMANSRMHKFN